MTEAPPRLHAFFNSSTSYRVRIALALKRLAYTTVPVNIRVGQQRDPTFLGPLNPSAGVPVLEIDGVAIAQSLAIIDYLDAIAPTPLLIPREPLARARVLGFANLIACDIHPLNNLRVLKFLQDDLGLTADQKDRWYRHWITGGFEAAERMLSGQSAGPFCFGETPSLADCCLVPQVANALRMNCAIDAYPRLSAIYHHAIEHAAFREAAPNAQPDYVA